MKVLKVSGILLLASGITAFLRLPIPSQEEVDARRLVEQLDSDDRPTRRYLAYITLSKMDGTGVVDDVVRLLDHEVSDVRVSALRLLGGWRIRQRESVIAVSLKDEDARVREAAVDALADLPAKVSDGLVAACLEDSDKDVRNRAAVALGRINALGTADRIAAAWKGEKLLPAAAAEGLLLMTPPARPDVILGILDTLSREPARVQFGDCMVDHRRKCLRGIELLFLACERGPDDLLVALVKRSKDYPAHHRSNLLHAISNKGRASLAKALDAKGLLEDKDFVASALDVCGRNLTAGDVPLYVGLIRRLDPERKRLIGTIGTPFVDEFFVFADDPDATVRRIVLQVLYQDPRRRHMARILKYSEDPEPAVRVEFLQFAPYAATTEHHEAIGNLLKDPDPRVVWAATQTVGQFGLTRFADRVAALMKEEKHRVVAMFAIARLGAKEHSALIVPMLSDPDCARPAAELLGGLGAPERIPDLLKSAEKGGVHARGEAIRAAARLGGPIPGLGDWMADKEAVVRAAAADAAGILRHRDSIDALAKLLQDRSHLVRAGAIGALAALEARDHLPAIMAIVEQGYPPRDEEEREEFYADYGPVLAIQAAVDAVGQMGTAEAARELAAHWKRSRITGFGADFTAALIRLDARANCEPLLSVASNDQNGPAFAHLNRAGAPRLYASLRTRALDGIWNSEYATLDRLASKASQALGLAISVSTAVPDEIRHRRALVHPLAPDRNEGLASNMNSWHECVLVYDEKAGGIRILTVPEAKRFWIEWAKAR